MLVYVILILPALTLAVNSPLLGLDGDKDGKITLSETQAYFQAYDPNHNGEITRTEVSAAVDKVDPGFVGHESFLFAVFDRDSNGQISAAEIVAAFKIGDLNKDNFIDKNEMHMLTVLASIPIG